MNITLKQIHKLRLKINELRIKKGNKSGDLEVLAKACGRKRHKRGKEPTWVNPEFRKLRPLSIPHHSRELNRFTANSILDQLEGDLDFIENWIEDLPQKGVDL